MLAGVVVVTDGGRSLVGRFLVRLGRGDAMLAEQHQTEHQTEKHEADQGDVGDSCACTGRAIERPKKRCASEPQKENG